MSRAKELDRLFKRAERSALFAMRTMGHLPPTLLVATATYLKQSPRKAVRRCAENPIPPVELASFQ